MVALARRKRTALVRFLPIHSMGNSVSSQFPDLLPNGVSARTVRKRVIGAFNNLNRDLVLWRPANFKTYLM